MAKFWRHLKALTKKNGILWIRTPCCACFEILVPAILMAFMVILRHYIPVAPIDSDAMLKNNMPVFPGVTYYKGQWMTKNELDELSDEKNRPLIAWSGNTHDRDHEDDLWAYTMETDDEGPQYYYPTHCMAKFDYQKGNPQFSNIIGIIGEQTNITDSIGAYYVSLTATSRRGLKYFLLPDLHPVNFTTTKDLEDYISDPLYKSDVNHTGVCMAIEHVVDKQHPNKYTFKVHYPDKNYDGPLNKMHWAMALPDQNKPVWSAYDSDPDLLSFLRYTHNGYSYLQNVLANQILINHTKDWQSYISLMLQPVRSEAEIADPYGRTMLAVLMPVFLLLSYIPAIYNAVFKIVREKESRTKETMRIMGMRDSSYWLSWFLWYSFINTVSCTLSWGILAINCTKYSQTGYVWLFFWLYGEAVFGQIIFLQSLFTGSKYAGIVSTVVYFASVFVNYLINGHDVSRAAKVGASLLPQVALMQGSVVFANYETSGAGLYEQTAEIMYYNYSFNTALWMLAVDFVLYTIVGLYLDKVIPTAYGQRLNPCFCFCPSFYGCCKTRSRRGQVGLEGDREALIDADYDDEFERAQMPNENYEPPSQMCKQLEARGDYLRVQNLQKTFSGGFLAVKGVNIKFFDGQIFAMLGHNGAGKTTIISMLTGLLNKSEGDGICYDVNLFEEMEKVREFMGVCPQHDVLFDLLTPREHLEIFYDFKGGNPEQKQREIDALICDVGLDIDQNKVACTLSGGTKRKTSVCVALCGGSKLVMLDEPTSGMDLGARRNLWDMLKSYKKDRIIILTTHHMDEADVLGDRIGIMVQGQLQCIGSPLFLKNRFGVGNRITFVKKNRKAHPGLEKYLQSYFSGVQKASEVHEEISFVIPKSQAINLGGFFESLDQQLDEFEIKSYGVSMSNLEDVFLKINKEYAPELFSDLKQLDSSTLSREGGVKDAFALSIGHSSQNSDQVRDSQLQNDYGAPKTQEGQEDDEDMENMIRDSSCSRSCKASTTKRALIYRRDWCGLLCQIVIPLVMVVFGLLMTTRASSLIQSPPRPLSTGFYPYKQRIIMNEHPANMTGDGTDGLDMLGHELAAQLPNATDAFEIVYKDNLSYSEFYDAFYEARKDGEPFPYRYGSFQIYRADKSRHLYQVSAYLNVTSQDVTALYPQYLYGALLRAATGETDLEFNVVSQAFPVYQRFKDEEAASRALDLAFMTAIALALIPCVIVQFILNERELQLKHQQMLAGMSIPGYWVSNILFDILMAYIPIGLIILLMALFDKFYDGAWVLFLLYPPAVVPYTYVISFLFKSDINAQINTLFLHFIAAGLGVSVVFTLQQIPEMMLWGDALRWTFTIVPSFCVTHGLLWSASGNLIRENRTEPTTQDGVPIPRQLPADLWAWYNLEGDAVILVIHCVVNLFLLTLIETEAYRYLDWMPCISCRFGSSEHRQGPSLVKDDDVIEEEKRVAIQESYDNDVGEPKDQDFGSTKGGQKDPTKMDCIRVHKFQKIYEPEFQEPVMAVKEASFSVDYGECFALLGVNGAGKSTTFKSLTREIVPTIGDITIQGYNVQQQFSEARKLIGYCPQYDALFPILTVEETLTFYALIKGVQGQYMKQVVDNAIKQLNLKDYKKKLASELSGGNKRKLQVAIAIIGNPPIILLDEPSAGMDPEARRFMWQVVEKISRRDKKSAVILTTHSMEEAEALSTKLGIMVRGGVFRCMGSSQHIKDKFGVGYEVEIKVKKATYNELQSMATELNFSNDLRARVNLKAAIGDCEVRFDPLILDQIREGGLGSDLILEASNSQSRDEVRVRNLLTYLNAQDHGFKVINWMCSNFAHVELLEQCGEFFKLRVPKQDKTIGWLFGQLENEKRELGIQEYNVTQTTLEQIFQSFAQQSISSDKAAFTFQRDFSGKVVLVNPDRKMTADQESRSQRGLSFHNEPMIQPPSLGQDTHSNPDNVDDAVTPGLIRTNQD